MPRNYQLQKTIVVADSSPREEKDKCESKNFHLTPKEEPPERCYPIQIRKPPVKYNTSYMDNPKAIVQYTVITQVKT